LGVGFGFGLQHIKTAAIQALLERDITKEDPEFKELWNWVVRGSGFALVSFCFFSLSSLFPISLFRPLSIGGKR